MHKQLAEELQFDSEVARLFPIVTSAPHCQELYSYLKYGTSIHIQVFDSLLRLCLRALAFEYAKFFRGVGSEFVKIQLPELVQEAKQLSATFIQIAWRLKAGRNVAQKIKAASLLAARIKAEKEDLDY